MPSGPSPIVDIRLVARFERRPAGFSFRASSQPGHLLHLVIDGEVEQSCNGRRYRLSAGDLLWYHDDELVEGVVRKAPWTFLSVLLHAPGLPPPDHDHRLLRGTSPRVRTAFTAMLPAWTLPTGPLRTLTLHAGAHALLAALPEPLFHDTRSGQGHDRWWWQAEERIRSDPMTRWSVTGLATALAIAPRTLERACQAATGSSPRRRIAELQLRAARGLVLRSSLPLGAIAAQGGWGRLQEFSRAYRQRFGLPPSSDRKHGDDWHPPAMV